MFSENETRFAETFHVISHFGKMLLGKNCTVFPQFPFAPCEKLTEWKVFVGISFQNRRLMLLSMRHWSERKKRCIFTSLCEMIYISRDGRDSTLKDSRYFCLAREGNVKWANIASASRFYDSLRVSPKLEQPKRKISREEKKWSRKCGMYK